MENDDKFDKTIDHDNGGGAAPEASNTGASWVKRGLVAALAVAAVAGVGVTLAQGSGWGPGGWGPGGWGHGGPGFGERGLERMLDSVDATADQEKKIWAIVDGARGEIRPIMRDFRDTRGQLAELLSAPTIDRAAMEKLRAERVASIDQASRKVTDAMMNAAEALTPEQRAKLAERFKQRFDRQ